MSRLSSLNLIVAMVGWLPTEPPGARGAVSSTPWRTRLGDTPSSRATRITISSPVRAVGAVAGLVDGVDTVVPDTEVAWPR